MPRIAAAPRPSSRGATHLIYAALYEAPSLVDGWRDAEQIETNDRMLRNLMGALEPAAPDLRHVALLQGTKAYGVHVRPLDGAGARGPLGNVRAAEFLLGAGEFPARAADAARAGTGASCGRC